MNTLGPIPRAALTSSCVAPILFTYAFIAFREHDYSLGLIFVTSVVLLGIACSATLWLIEARSYAEKISIVSFKPADKEISGYFVSYLIPLVGAPSEFYQPYTGMFFTALFFMFVWTSKSFYTNPLLALFGYKFYEISIESGCTMLLVTKKNIKNKNQINKIAYATNYTVVQSKK